MCKSEKDVTLRRCVIHCVKQMKHHTVAEVCSSVSEWFKDRTWMHGGEHTVGSYGHNSSFAGYCYLPEKLALCLVTYVISAFHCCKGIVSHIALFVKHTVNPNFMHLFHAAPYLSSI